MRHAAIGIFLFVLIGIVIYTASMTGTSGMVGGGSDSVPHCQVLYYSIAVSDIISSVNANVECDIMDSYTVTASVTSGASTGSGADRHQPHSRHAGGCGRHHQPIGDHWQLHL